MMYSMKREMNHELQVNNEANTTELPSQTITANVTQTTSMHFYQQSKINSLALHTHSSGGVQQLIQSKQERRRSKQKLRTLLFELLAITTTAATPIAFATTTIATRGTRLIQLRNVIGTPSDVIFPLIATNAMVLRNGSMPELPTTIATTLNAIIGSVVTSKAFIQMNVTAYRTESLDASATSMLDNNVAATTTTTTTTATTISANLSSNNSSTCALLSIYAYLGALPWPNALVVAIFVLLFLVTVAGNLLVIVSVLTTRRLRTVTNCFVLNLAITDLLVGLFVMPPAVILYVVGSWHFGWILCDIWISLDVLLCTGSILSLCAISLDRYLAVTQPLTYSKKRRSKRLALFMILIVWVTAVLITCPPYFGWYEKVQNSDGNFNCRYNQNKGYVVFSAMGSFFIPLAVMMYVYLKIGYVLKSRRQRIVRDANSERVAEHDIDCDNFISESEHYQCASPRFPSFKMRWSSVNGCNNICTAKQLSLNCEKCSNQGYVSNINKPNTFNDGLGTNITNDELKHQTSFYELVEVSHLTSIIQCSAINCKYAGVCVHSEIIDTPLTGRRSISLPRNVVHLVEDGMVFTESFLPESANQASNASINTTTQSMKMNQCCGQQNQNSIHRNQNHHHQQHNHNHNNQQRPHHSHRIPMRVSTAKKGDTKTAKTLTTVMGGFIACWLPFFVYYLLKPFLPAAAVSEGLMSFLTWVGWVNCAINPFIYAFYNPDFRTAFRRIACKIICKKIPPSNHMAMFRG